MKRLVTWRFASLTTPPHSTNRVLVELIAEKASIAIDTLSADLDLPVFLRAQVVFGYAGDEIDNIAQQYPNMRWWISEKGLCMVTVQAVRSGSGDDSACTDSAGNLAPASAAPPKRGRGRPAEISTDCKERGLKAQQRGASAKEVAQEVYNTATPSKSQVKNAPNILTHYRASRNRTNKS